MTDVRIEFDPKQASFRIPVTIEIEPERFTEQNLSEAERRASVDKLVASGLRAQLKSGNLLTGQLDRLARHLQERGAGEGRLERAASP